MNFDNVTKKNPQPQSMLNETPSVFQDSSGGLPTRQPTPDTLMTVRRARWRDPRPSLRASSLRYQEAVSCAGVWVFLS